MVNYLFYSKKVLEQFRKPNNIGVIKDADGIGKVGNIVCGDEMTLYLKIGSKNKKQIIKDIKVQTFGCVAAIATSSTLSQIAKGKTIKEALKISHKDIIKKLGSLPKIKMHCSFLALDALAEAIHNYLQKTNRPIPQSLEKKHWEIKKRQKILEKRF